MKNKTFFQKAVTVLIFLCLTSFTGCHSQPAPLSPGEPPTLAVTFTPSPIPTVSPTLTPTPVSTPTPEETPTPTATVSPVSTPEVVNICSLTVQCKYAISYLKKINSPKLEYLPESGIILSLEQASFQDGETVFDLLKRELSAQGIPFEFNVNPMFQSAYIEGICNLYEFDCGDQSGWLYRVNHKPASVGCSQYPLSPGDIVEFIYTASYGDLYE